MRKVPQPMFSLSVRLCDLLDEIHACFKPGAVATIVVRNPAVDDGDVVMGNDDPDKVIEAINRLKSRPAFVEAGEKVVPAVSDQEKCQHLKVSYDPVTLRGLATEHRWICEDCAKEFFPKPDFGYSGKLLDSRIRCAR